MDIYWYAPFDNATELELAEHLCRPDDTLTLQSLTSRFGKALSNDATGFRLVRDLPPPANELPGETTRLRRARVAVDRAILRHLLVSNEAYDLVHLHTFNMYTDVLALRLLRQQHRPLVLSVHNVRPHDRRTPRSIETLLHTAYRIPDHLVVAHDSLADRLCEDFRVPRDRVSTIPLPSPSYSRTQPGPEADPKELLFIGTLRQNKGIEVLLDAMEHLPRSLPVILRIAGRGDADLEELVAERAERDDRIQVEIGWIPEPRLAELYSRAWAVVVPYNRAFAAQSGTVRVAYSFGTPVLATDVGALGRTIRQDGTGWLVPDDDPTALARCMEEVASADGERDRKAALAAQLGQERSAPNLARRFRALYDTLADSGAAR